MKLIFNIFLGMLLIFKGYATALPKNCDLLGVQADNLLLKGKTVRLVFIHNISGTDLYLTHVPVDKSEDAGMQAGWTSRINKNKWNVIKIGKKPLKFQCVEYRPGHEQLVSCQNNISVCHIGVSEYPDKDSGDYWVAENQSLSNALQTVSSRGFQLTKNKE